MYKKKPRKRGSTKLFRRRLYVTLILIVLAGFSTAAAFVLTKQAKADVGYDPYFTLSTGQPKVRIFQPLYKSVGNQGTFTAAGTAPPSTTISIKVDGVAKGTATTNSSGQWTKSISGVADGDHTLTASTTLGGPYSLVSSSLFIPSYATLDLSTNSMTTASTTGFATALYAGLVSKDDDFFTPGNSVRVSDRYAYLIRQRTVSVFDALEQRVVKTIVLADQFVNNDSSGYTSEKFVQAQLSHDGARMYLLYANSNNTKILALDTTTNTLISDSGFPATAVAGASKMVLSADGSKLYVIAYNSDQFGVVSTTDGSSSQMTLGAYARDMAISPSGDTVYISKSQQDGSYYIAAYDTAAGTINDQSFDLQNSLEASTMYAGIDGKLYVASSNEATLRVLDTATKDIVASINMSSIAIPQTSQITKNADGSRIFVPLQDNNVAIINTASNELRGVINPPTSNHRNIHALLYYNNSLYVTYDRNPGISDALDSTGNPSKLFSSVGVANTNAAGSVTATPISVNGVSSVSMSAPLATTPIQLNSSTDFSVGDVVKITSPTADDTLSTSTPTIKGTGPKNSVIQLSINKGSPISVNVDGNGNWQKAVTLQKSRSNSVAVVYANKRSQLLLPNLFVFGSDIAKNQLSVIDGQSGLEQQPITLPPVGINSLRLNLSAATNPNGQRYYVANLNATTFLTDHMDMLMGYVTGSTTPQEGDLNILQDLQNTPLGSVEVYSTQTKQKAAPDIAVPNGLVPISIAVNKDGTQAILQSLSVKNEMDLIMSGGNGVMPSPLVYSRIDLKTNEIQGDPIATPFDVSTFSSNDDGFTMGTSITSMAVGALSKPGVYSNDGKQFFATQLGANKVTIIDTATGDMSTLNIQQDSNTTTVPLGIQTSPINNVLYVSYFDVRIDDQQSMPYLSPGMMMIDLSNNTIAKKVPMTNVPLFNFVVDNVGAKVYMITLDLQELIEKVTGTISNPQAVFIDTLPTFSITTMDLNYGTLTSKPVTDTEIPYNLVMSPDGSQIFMPTLLHNKIHAYDVSSGQVDPGNYPVILSGISTALATTSNVGSVTLGTYTDDATYFVPPDAPVTQDTTKTVTDKVYYYGASDYRNIPTSGGTTILTGQPLSAPSQAIQVIRDTAQQSLTKKQTEAKSGSIRSWLIYILYATFLAILLVTGFATWKTNMLLGGTTEEDYI